MYIRIFTHIYIVFVYRSMSKIFEPPNQTHHLSPYSTPTPITTTQDSTEQSEEDKIATMFKQTSEFWEKTQEQMAS